jgi:hypothetical protein
MENELQIKCDRVLGHIWANGRSNSNITDLTLRHSDLNYTQREIEDIFCILSTDGFVVLEGRHTCAITDKGITFIHTDNYVNRKKRWDIEAKTKKYSYRYRWLSWIFSAAALVVSIIALVYTISVKKTTTQILLLPEKEMKKELTKPLMLNLKDTLHMR